jgi:uncharacterized protein YndB with AHSA1/START domain
MLPRPRRALDEEVFTSIAAAEPRRIPDSRRIGSPTDLVPVARFARRRTAGESARAGRLPARSGEALCRSAGAERRFRGGLVLVDLLTWPGQQRTNLKGTVMRSYEANSFIEATPEQVWSVLTDTAAWPDWDSGITKVDGRATLGAKMSITTKVNPGRAIPIKVVQLSAPKRMVFRGGMPLGLFTGQLTYTLVPEGTGTRFTMREEYTGPLAGMIFKKIPDLTPSFRQFAEGLKHRAE